MRASDEVSFSEFMHASWLGTGDGDPIKFPKSFTSPAVGGDIVAIPDDEDLVVRLYDTTGGSARQIGQVAGDHGDLTPDGRYYVALPPNGAGRCCGSGARGSRNPWRAWDAAPRISDGSTTTPG